ncbi:hypothetical protein [Clostridium ganghwense]|uniref:Lipoprotein n=1 Tax=Clostridium ganghwense TaxID=312089 RepID=A0ABT4CPK0_9CLOT|nr:hypothetical protein [Clostridium ganghwense]MCY6370984.1 hypothetical protein [Clostridium ganghwense]
MQNKRKSILFVVISILALNLFGCAPKSKYKGTVLEPIDKLVNVLYFNTGTYSDYKAIFTNPDTALTEEEFNNFRKNPDKNEFKYGTDSPDEIMSHIKAIPENDNLATVYYLEDVNKTDESESSMQWKVENKAGKWLLKND